MQVRTLFIHHLVAQYLHDDGIVRKTLSLAFSFLSFFLCAQSRDTANAPVITFDETTHDFGTVVQGTVVTHEFRFTNTGKTPLVITNVCGSAGSVVPSFTKEPVAPGKNGMVKVIFSTTGNLGMQDKTVTLTSNAKDNTVVLHIKGQVIFPEQPLLVEKVILRNALQKPVDEYGKPLNGQSQQWPGCFLDIDTVTTGEKISFAFILRNQGNSPVRIMDVTNDKYISSNDEYISASASKISVAPGDTVKISATLSTKRLGPERRSVIVSYFPDDTRTYTSLYLHVKGFVIDPSLPVLSLSENGPLHDTVTQGAVYSHDFYFTNKGQQPLVIHSVSSYEGTYVNFPTDSILPGKSGVIHYQVFTAYRNGTIYASMTIDSNNGTGLVGIPIEVNIKRGTSR